MADVKISALPAATTPLAGTELVPIVQSGVTSRVSVDNMTAGRTVAAATVNVDANTASAAVRITQTGAGSALVVEDSASPDATPFVVDASGAVIVGNSTTFATRLATTTITPFSQVIGTTAATSAFLNARFSADVNGPQSFFAKSRSATRGAQALVSDGDSLGLLSFGGSDGVQITEAARLTAAVDGAPGTNDMPGRLVFSTTADGGVTPAERMRISSAGFTTLTGSFGRAAPVTKAGSFTLAATENWVICNAAGTVTITFPAASSWTGREVMVKTIAAQTVVSASSNVVPIDSSVAGTAILSATAGAWATLVSDGTNWVVMQRG